MLKSCYTCAHHNNLNSVVENECSAPQLKDHLAIVPVVSITDLDDNQTHQNKTVQADACRDFTFACGPEAKWHTPK